VGTCGESPLDGEAERLAPPPDVDAEPIPEDPNVEAVENVEIGEIPLADGRLYLDDVFALSPESFRVDTRAEPARYPVCARIARYRNSSHAIAFVEVRLADEPVARWRERAGGFGVDGGTGAVANAPATETLQAWSVDEWKQYMDDLSARLEEADERNPAYLTAELASDGVLVVFSTGFGDGGYPVYVAENAAGRPVSIVADFLLLPWDRLFEHQQ
jgi:Protein of unknown function (DUF4241)